MRCAHNFFNPPAVRWPFLSPSFHPNVKIFHNAHPISLVSYPIDNQDVSHTCHFAFQNRPFHRPKRTFSRSQTDLFRVSNGLFRNCVNIFHKFLTRHINNSRRVILPHDQRTNKLIRSFDRPDNNKRRPRKLITGAAFILMSQATLDHNSNTPTTSSLHASSDADNQCVARILRRWQPMRCTHPRRGGVYPHPIAINSRPQLVGRG